MNYQSKDWNDLEEPFFELDDLKMAIALMILLSIIF